MRARDGIRRYACELVRLRFILPFADVSVRVTALPDDIGTIAMDQHIVTSAILKSAIRAGSFGPTAVRSRPELADDDVPSAGSCSFVAIGRLARTQPPSSFPVSDREVSAAALFDLHRQARQSLC